MPSLDAFMPPDELRALRGRAVRAVGRTYLRLAGWRIAGAFPAVPKFVTIVAPHTSNWDFPLGLATMFALDFKSSWLGKHTLFKGPFDGIFRRLGGIPVDRRANFGVVEACVKAFEAAPALMLSLAPEGTRKGAARWRTGFYQIAHAAQVPILPVGFDFREKVIHLMPLFQPCGDLERDLPLIQALFRDIHGLKSRPAPGPA